MSGAPATHKELNQSFVEEKSVQREMLEEHSFQAPRNRDWKDRGTHTTPTQDSPQQPAGEHVQRTPPVTYQETPKGDTQWVHRQRSQNAPQVNYNEVHGGGGAPDQRTPPVKYQGAPTHGAQRPAGEAQGVHRQGSQDVRQSNYRGTYKRGYQARGGYGAGPAHYEKRVPRENHQWGLRGFHYGASRGGHRYENSEVQGKPRELNGCGEQDVSSGSPQENTHFVQKLKKELEEAKSEIQRQIQKNSSLEQIVAEQQRTIAAMKMTHEEEKSKNETDRRGLEEAVLNLQTKLEEVKEKQETNASTEKLQAECHDLQSKLQKEIESNKILEQRCKDKDRRVNEAREELEAHTLFLTQCQEQQMEHDTHVNITERNQNKKIEKLRGDLEKELQTNAELQKQVKREQEEKDVLKKCQEDVKTAFEGQQQTVESLQKQLEGAQCRERDLRQIQKSQDSLVVKLKTDISAQKMVNDKLQQLTSDQSTTLKQRERELSQGLSAAEEMNRELQQEREGLQTALKDNETHIQVMTDELNMLKLLQETQQRKKRRWRFWKRR